YAGKDGGAAAQGAPPPSEVDFRRCQGSPEGSPLASVRLKARIWLR
ncbi:unnamed protein product, partial [Ectocarpus sp. 8 AP-2014]